MAGLTRKTSIQFGANGPSTAFGQFGSKVAAATQTSQDPAVIQALAAWGEGWQNAIVAGDKAAYLQDMNGFCFVDSYQLTYILQMGIPEYDTTGNTLYFTGSVVQIAASGQWFRSWQGGVPGVDAGQSGHAPPSGASDAFWQWLNPQAVLDGGITVGKIPQASATAPGKLVDSRLSDDGTNIVIASGGIKFPDATVQTTAPVSSNAVSIQSPPAAFVDAEVNTHAFTRAIGGLYQNTKAKPRWVLFSYIPGGVGVTVYCDGSNPPVTAIAPLGGGIASAPIAPCMFLVLPRYYYKVVGGTLQQWVEWT